MQKLNFIDHIVLIVKSVEETEKFYSLFLGEPIVKNEESVAYQIGETKIFFGLPYAEQFKIGDKDAGGFNHLAFGVRTLEELKTFQDILDKNNIKNSGVQIDRYGKKEFIWFDDPHNYRIEFYLRN